MVWPRRSMSFRPGRYSIRQMRRSPTSNGRSARRKTRSTSSWESIRTTFLGVRPLVLKQPTDGSGASPCRRSYPPGYPRNYSSAGQISIKQNRTWWPRMQTSEWPKQCSFLKYPCSVREAPHLDTVSLLDRISQRLSELEPTRRALRSQFLRAAPCATTCATPSPRNDRL